jgi:ABC-2 type transport system permease protein
MKQFITFVKKEFRHILRDPRSLIIIIGLPIVQIVTFGFALTNEVKNSNIAILDQSKDESTNQLTARLDASRYFEVSSNLSRTEEIEAAFRAGKTRMVVVFPPNFREKLVHDNTVAVQLIADASDPNVATTVINYASAIIQDYQHEWNKDLKMPHRIMVEQRMLYNPQLKGAYSFVPGIMALVLLLISCMMTALAVVKEKESGTMEVLLASPMRPIVLILSKVVPYLCISIINWLIIVGISYYFLDVPVKGNFYLLFAVSVVFIIAALSLGLLISSITDSQQVAMLISLMGMMMPTLLFSGFMFPIDNMPLPMQVISNIVPSKWYYDIVKNIMIKGVGIEGIYKEVLILSAMTLFFIVVSWRKFKLRL